MDADMLTVRMLGDFSIEYGDLKISSGTNRSYKAWLVMAYLLCNRGRQVPLWELVGVLGGIDGTENPIGALRSTLWRAQRLLDPLSERLGKKPIINKKGVYSWNPETPVILDAEQFEALCDMGGAEEEASRLERLRQALALYQGPFLSKLSTEPWVMSLAAHYDNLYNAALRAAAPLLLEAGDVTEAEVLCRAALRRNPYDEELTCNLMRVLLAQNDSDGARMAYEDLREQLFAELGVLPGQEAAALYEQALSRKGGGSLSAEELVDRLRECPAPVGPMMCDYRTFRLMYHAEARSTLRRGDSAFIGVLSVVGKNGIYLTGRKLQGAMDRLGEQIRLSLRAGDVAARCSPSQYALLLLQVNDENSGKVCRRVAQAYAHTYPHSSAEICFTTLPIEPAGQADEQSLPDDANEPAE